VHERIIGGKVPAIAAAFSKGIFPAAGFIT